MPSKQPNLYGLTLKQSIFVDEYIKDKNALQAAIRAGYSEASAGWRGCTLLKDPKVQAAIEDRLQAAQARSQVTVDRVLTELARIAFADITDIVSVEGGKVRVRDTRDLPPETRKAISEITETGAAGGTIKVKLHDKIKALELIGRHLAMFKDKLDVDAGETIVGVLAELARRREAAAGGDGPAVPGR